VNFLLTVLSVHGINTLVLTGSRLQVLPEKLQHRVINYVFNLKLLNLDLLINFNFIPRQQDSIDKKSLIHES